MDEQANVWRSMSTCVQEHARMCVDEQCMGGGAYMHVEEHICVWRSMCMCGHINTHAHVAGRRKISKAGGQERQRNRGFTETWRLFQDETILDSLGTR